MKAINNKIWFISLLFCTLSLKAHANWQIIGDIVELETPIILEQIDDNSQEFVYVGKMTNQLFKITDGVQTYIHECGESDPLGESILLREANPDERGLRIRYVGLQDYFKVTLHVTEDTKSIEVERIEPAKNVYIMGGPFNKAANNWNLQDAVELEIDNKNPFIFYYKGDIRYNVVGDERGSFKILKGRSWGENYHPAASGNVPLAQAIGTPQKIRLGGEDNKWTIPSDQSGDGYYEIKIDLLNLTITVEKFVQNIIQNPFPLAIYIVGDAMPCGWNNEHPMMMAKIEDGVYHWGGKVSQGEFKFLQRRNTWERCYVATSANEKVFSGKEHDVVYEENYTIQGNDYKFVIPQEGMCNLTLNLNTMKLKVDGLPTTNIANNDNGITLFTNNGKLFLISKDNKPIKAHIFDISGIVIAQKTFVGNAEFTLSKGCYIVLLNNEAGIVAKTKAIVL